MLNHPKEGSLLNNNLTALTTWAVGRTCSKANTSLTFGSWFISSCVFPTFYMVGMVGWVAKECTNTLHVCSSEGVTEGHWSSTAYFYQLLIFLSRPVDSDDKMIEQDFKAVLSQVSW